MKRFAMILAAAYATGLVLASAAQAKQMYTDPDKCVAEIGTLDKNGDGYVDNTEYSAYGKIDTNVDTDGDGKISNDEKVVACKGGVMLEIAPQ